MDTANFRSGLVALTLLVAGVQSPATAQPVAGKVQPDALEFGTVQVGATVEGSVRVYAAGDDTAGAGVSVEPPPFVRVVDVKLGTNTYGQLGTMTHCAVSVSISTEDVGRHSGELVVKVRDQQVAVPVSAEVVLKDPLAVRLLVVESPFHNTSTSDNSLFDPWRELVKAANFNVDYWEITDWHSVFARRDDVSQFDVILIGGAGLVALRPDDVDALVTFAERGGRVVLAANRFFRGTVENANSILHHAALHMDDLESREFREVDVTREDFAEHQVTNNVAKLAFFRPSPILVTDADRADLLVSIPKAEFEGFVAIGKLSDGEVAVLGESLWWNWIAAEYSEGSDNALLLRQLLTHRKANEP